MTLTYSWGNTYENGGNFLVSNGIWLQGAIEDKAAANDALARGWAIKAGDSDLDPFVQQAFDKLENPPDILRHPWTPLYNCKFEADRLIRWAEEMKKISDEKRCD